MNTLAIDQLTSQLTSVKSSYDLTTIFAAKVMKVSCQMSLVATGEPDNYDIWLHLGDTYKIISRSAAMSEYIKTRNYILRMSDAERYWFYKTANDIKRYTERYGK